MISSYKLYHTLNKVSENRLRVDKQYINSYNKCSYLILKDKQILPVDLSGPLYINGLTKTTNLIPVLEYKDNLKNISKINRLLRGRFEFLPIAKYVHEKNIIGIKLEGGYIIPIKPTKLINDKLPIIIVILILKLII